MSGGPRARAATAAPRAGARRRVLSVAPATALRLRHPVVVDCGVLAAVLFDEPGRDAALRRLAGAALHAPWLLDFEIASAAAHKARAGHGELAAQGLTDYRALAIERRPVDPFAQAGLAMSYRITTPNVLKSWDNFIL